MSKIFDFRIAVAEKISGNMFYMVLPLLLFLGLFYIYPMLRMLGLSFNLPAFSLEHYLGFFKHNLYLYALFVTFKVSVIVTIVCLLLGYPLAYYLTCQPVEKANLLIILILIPLWTSVLVRTFAWIVILGRNGIVNQLLLQAGFIEEPLRLLYNLFGVTIGMVHVMMPFMVLSLFSVMKGIDRRLLMAAQNLGATPLAAFSKVFLPLSMPGVFAGCTLVFIISVGFYVTPALLGGPRDVMIAMVIDQSVEVMLNFKFASAASMILLILTVGIFLMAGKTIGFDKLWGKNNG